MKNSHKLFFLLLTLFFLIRLPLIYWPLDLGFFESELGHCQLFIGAFAKDLLEGLRLPLWDYLQQCYGGGELVIAAWTVPFIALLGPNLFAVKLASLCWHSMALVLWYFVFRRYYSEGKTFFVLLFIVLAPPQITNMFLHSYGFHNDMILWMALSLLIFQNFLDGKLNEKKGGVLLGFLGGLSSWTVLTNLITAAVIWIYVGILRETKIRKSVFYLFYLPAFIAGLSPLIYQNHLKGWPVFDFLGSKVIGWGHPVLEFFMGAKLTVLYSLRVLFDASLEPSALRYLFGYGYLMLYLFSLIFLTWVKRRDLWYLRDRRDIEVFGIYFQWILLFLFVKNGNMDQIRYLMPLVPFMGVTLVGALECVGKRWGLTVGSVYRFALIGVCLLGGALGNLKILTTRYPQPDSTLSMRGVSYMRIPSSVIVQGLFAPAMTRREKLRQFVKDLPHSFQRDIYREFHFSEYGFEMPKDLSSVPAFIRETQEPFHPILYENLGMELSDYYAAYGYGDFILLLKNSNISREFHPFIFRGLVQDLGESEQKGLCLLLSEESKANCYEGLSIAERTPLLQILSPIPAWVEPNHVYGYLKGVGRRASIYSILEGEKIRSFVHTLDGSRREAFFKGFLEGISLEEDPYREWKMRQRFQELSVP